MLTAPPRVKRHGKRAQAVVKLIAIDSGGQRQVQDEILQLHRRGSTWVVSQPSSIFFRMLDATP
jgi:hypothetical protein